MEFDPTFFFTPNDCINFSNYRNRPREKIYFVCVASSVLNAVAIRTKKLNCIVISMNFVACLNLAVSLLDTSEYFSLAWNRDPIPQLSRQNSKTKSDGFKEVFFGGKPRSTSLRAIGINQICLSFLVFHEIGHLINGHLHSGIFSGEIVSESLSGNSYLSNSIRHALEFDADCFAAQEIMTQAYGRFSNYCSTNFGHDLYSTYQNSLISSLVSISITTGFLENNDGKYFAEGSRQTHPPGIYRAYNTLATCKAVWSKWNKNNTASNDQFSDFITRIYAVIFLAMMDKGNFVVDRRDHDEWMLNMAAYNNDILMTYGKIRSTLEKHMIGSHALAPSQYNLQDNG